MNNTKLFMGIDGGGTKTTVLVADEKGSVICRERGDNINFYVSGFDKSRSNLQAVLDRIYKKIDQERLAAVFIGMSAIEYEADIELTNKFTGNMFDCPVYMHTDAYVALMGHTFGNAGALLISGTGSIAIAMNPAGDLRVFGGWGYLLGDEGSAYHIALNGLRSATKAFDGIGRKTALCDVIINRFKLQKPQDMLNYFTPGISRPQIAMFAREVAACAEKGDEVAKDILSNAAAELTKMAAAAARFANCTKVGIYGGVLQNDRIVRDEFCKYLKECIPEGKAVFPELPPEAGAIIAAMNSYGLEANETIISRLKETIKHMEVD